MTIGYLFVLILNTAATAMLIYLISPTYIFSFIGMVVSQEQSHFIIGLGMGMFAFSIIGPGFAWMLMFKKRLSMTIFLSTAAILAGFGTIIFYNTYLAP